jgi:hypothetical protein
MTALSFTNYIKTTDPNSQPSDSLQFIYMDPYQQSNHGFIVGGWDGYIK